MKLRKWAPVLILITTLILAGCGAQATPTPAPTDTPTAAPSPTPGGDPVEAAMALITQPDGPVVARVNGVEIASDTYMGELERQIRFITEQYGMDWSDDYSQEILSEVEMQVFQQLVNVELVKQEAAKEGTTVSEDAVTQEIEATKEQILAEGQYTDWNNFLEVNSIDDQYFHDRIFESLLIDALLQVHGGPTTAEQVHAQHILVADEATAQQVLDELNAGATFEDLAKKYSTDTSNNQNGGDLDWFPRGVMAQPFEDAAFSAEVGSVVGPVQTDYGYHIIKVLGKETRPLTGDMLTQSQQQYFNDWFLALRDNANIEEVLNPGQ
jgi:parvulin-like peptidyl-prolyl isomerase